jgi:glycosyltransferase involved in cell wall biosynthesis
MHKLVYLLPVHNEEKHLATNVQRLASYLERLPESEVFLVENGSRDASWAVAEELAARATDDVPVHAFREESAGIGYAYQRGLVEAVKRFGPSTTRWAVLTAADLPFGFSDLEAALVDLEHSPGRILMGSKAHPHSRVETAPSRKAMTWIYRLARRALIGMQVGDSQGSVFIRLDLAHQLLPNIVARGFFYSTELCHLAERAGETILEVPIVCDPPQRPSTVRPIRDGLGMARELWRLRAKK